MAVKKSTVKSSSGRRKGNVASGGAMSFLRKTLLVFSVLLVAVLSAGGVWLLCMIPGKLLYKNPRFKLLRVETRGSGYWQGKGIELLAHGDIQLGKNIFTINPGKVKNSILARIGSIAEIDVQLVLPDTIVFKTIERIPRALLTDGIGEPLLVIDENGFIFPRHESTASNQRLPVIKAFDLKNRELLKEAVSLIVIANREYGDITIKEIVADNSMHMLIRLTYRNGKELKVYFPVAVEDYSVLFNRLQNAILNSAVTRDNPVGYDLSQSRVQIIKLYK